MPRPEGVNMIGTKCVYRNKIDDHGNIRRNNARLVEQGYTQVGGIDFDQTFAPVTCLSLSDCCYLLHMRKNLYCNRCM